MSTPPVSQLSVPPCQQSAPDSTPPLMISCPRYPALASFLSPAGVLGRLQAEGTAKGSPAQESLEQYAARIFNSPLAQAIDAFLAGRPSPVTSERFISELRRAGSPALPSLLPPAAAVLLTSSPTPSYSATFATPILPGVSPPSMPSPGLYSTGGTRMEGCEYFCKYVCRVTSTVPQPAPAKTSDPGRDFMFPALRPMMPVSGGSSIFSFTGESHSLPYTALHVDRVP